MLVLRGAGDNSGGAAAPQFPGRFISTCWCLFCAGIGSTAWPYVTEPSPSDTRLGTRDAELQHPAVPPSHGDHTRRVGPQHLKISLILSRIRGAGLHGDCAWLCSRDAGARLASPVPFCKTGAAHRPAERQHLPATSGGCPGRVPPIALFLWGTAAPQTGEACSCPLPAGRARCLLCSSTAPALVPSACADPPARAPPKHRSLPELIGGTN